MVYLILICQMGKVEMEEIYLDRRDKDQEPESSISSVLRSRPLKTYQVRDNVLKVGGKRDEKDACDGHMRKSARFIKP